MKLPTRLEATGGYKRRMKIVEWKSSVEMVERNRKKVVKIYDKNWLLRFVTWPAR